MLENLKNQIDNKSYYKAVVSGLEFLAESNNELVNALETTERKLSECWEYIRSKAKKEQKDGCACIEDNVVYGLAAEFYQLPTDEYEKFIQPEKKETEGLKEEPEENKEEHKEEPQELTKEEPEEKKVAKNVVVKNKQTKSDDDLNLKGQMNIFDILGGMR